MEKTTLKVSGMSCAHCEKAVKDALIALGAEDAAASAKENTVSVSYDPAQVSLEDIKKEIAEFGYEVQ